jgi:hypothetical protein
MTEELATQPIQIEFRFAVSFLRHLIKLLRPEVVGIAVMSAAREIGMPQGKALEMAERFMIEARVRPGWRPWPWIPTQKEKP